MEKTWSLTQCLFKITEHSDFNPIEAIINGKNKDSKSTTISFKEEYLIGKISDYIIAQLGDKMKEIYLIILDDLDVLSFVESLDVKSVRSNESSVAILTTINVYKKNLNKFHKKINATNGLKATLFNM